MWYETPGCEKVRVRNVWKSPKTFRSVRGLQILSSIRSPSLFRMFLLVVDRIKMHIARHQSIDEDKISVFDSTRSADGTTQLRRRRGFCSHRSQFNEPPCNATLIPFPTNARQRASLHRSSQARNTGSFLLDFRSKTLP